MPTLSRLSLTLAQDSEQAALKVVCISYGYTLSFEADEVTQPESFEVSVDVLGDDLLKDDELALGVDSHVISVDEQEVGPVQTQRSFAVGQQLLDEDVGEDEIKLRVALRNDTGELASAFTDVIRGNF